jgi:hypothetical protein
MNSMTSGDWAWFAGIMSVGLVKLYWVAKRTTLQNYYGRSRRFGRSLCF